MLIRAGYSIAFEAAMPTPMVALLSIRPECAKHLKSPHRVILTPDLPSFAFEDMFGNVVTRFTMPVGRTEISCDFTIADDGAPDPVSPQAQQQPIEELPTEVMPFLLASRYCETDLLLQSAWGLFGHTAPGWERVQAIVDYTHNQVRFDYNFADNTRTAWRGNQDRIGVCRDFAHLAIALCRCMNIPARYCTGYLGDIGIPPVDAPMDFSAWFEVYLDGKWHTFDARHNTPRIGRIPMAIGRDAADAALTTSFGNAALVKFDVHCDEVAAVPA